MHEIIVHFQSWVVTKNVKLKVCCGNLTDCPLEVSNEVKRHKGSGWSTRHLICPTSSSKVIFVCANSGISKGACGVDDVQIYDGRCDKSLSPAVDD
ncbi:hypothetical protein AB6A40_009379 [Gnathostoma spinigerum]|uniref:Uncharacterized protein n=1 Tax=Gnathostoma spinigerum TaxID=75299 RepID=A0ABD6ERT2_9BILA